MLEQMREREKRRERSANRRAGLVASQMYNAWLKPEDAPRMQPMDFWQEPGPPERMTPEEAREHFTAWAEGRNQTVH